MARQFTQDDIVGLTELFNRCFYTTNEALTVLDRGHGYIHAGRHYTSGWIETSRILGAPYVMYMTTGAGFQSHLIGILSTASAGLAEFIYNPTVTVAGTLNTVNNRRPAMAVANQSTVHYGATITGGTVMDAMYMESGTNLASTIGGAERSAQEFVIEDGDIIAIRFTPSANGKFVLGFDRYEVEG